MVQLNFVQTNFLLQEIILQERLKQGLLLLDIGIYLNLGGQS